MRKNIYSSAIDQFHQRIVNELTQCLKDCQLIQTKKLKQLQNNTPSINNILQQVNLQYFNAQCIGQFFYDILQLQNSSIDFIMKQIFESNKRSSWHLQQILKIVLDVQFVITVNNFRVSKYQKQNKSKIRDQEISFLKIQAKELVENIYQSCFFVKKQQNHITKQLIQKMVDEINQQNGKKGYILLVEYKNFINHNVIDKHNIRKFLTPKKQATINPQVSSQVSNQVNSRQKYQHNSQSIREVDEESEAMSRSNRNYQTNQFSSVNNLKVDEYSKLTVDNKESSERKISTQRILINAGQINDKDCTFNELLWRCLKDRLNLNHNGSLSHNQILQKSKQLFWFIFQEYNINSIQRLSSKLKGYYSHHQNENLSQSIILSILIKLIGQQGFKIFHDNKMKQLKSKLKINSFLLDQKQLKQIFTYSFIKLFTSTIQQLDQIFQRFIIEISHLIKVQKQVSITDLKLQINFKEYLNFIQKIGQIKIII